MIKSQHYYQGGQEGVLNFLPPIPCITGPRPFFLAFLPQWGISGKSWWGCATQFSKSWSYFRRKLSLSTPVFRPKITYICLKFISNSHVILLSCSFGIKMTNTFVHSRSSLENHSWFQTKMCKVYTLFQTAPRQYIPIWLLKGSTIPLDFFQLQNITRKLWLPALLELPPLISLLQSILLGSLYPPDSYPSCCLSFWVPYPPLTHIPPAAYSSGFPIPPNSYPSCCLSFWGP